jgi:hypothetical protein
MGCVTYLMRSLFVLALYLILVTGSQPADANLDTHVIYDDLPMYNWLLPLRCHFKLLYFLKKCSVLLLLINLMFSCMYCFLAVHAISYIKLIHVMLLFCL